MSEGIRVRVRVFSHVRAALEAGELELELPRGATAGTARDRILEMSGERLRGLPVRIAVNQAFVTEGHALGEGDEVAILPPVQGG